MSLARVIGSLALAALLAFWPVHAARADGPPDPRSVPAQHGKAHAQHALTEFPSRRPVAVPVALHVPVPAADACDVTSG
ncbi:hypothetical protein ABUW04_21690 [Streptacidiphilus sp. N1-10]|uniref:Uncharacterized protein n=1 Tax=Streptacidiphilus jeojiensis TaxID=3229225 RepID=A0ABV6XRG9_9ACTN